MNNTHFSADIVRRRHNGFTLIEVIVALLVSAMALALLMNGAVTAKSRQQQAQIETQALIMAETLLDGAMAQPIEDISAYGEGKITNGKNGAFHWTMATTIAQSDPRGQFHLLHYHVRIGTQAQPDLLTLSRDKLMAIHAWGAG